MNDLTEPPLSYTERFIGLWNEGKNAKEIATILTIPLTRVQQRIFMLRRQYGVERVPYRVRTPKPKALPFPCKPKLSTAQWEPVAALWRDGKNSAEIAGILKTPAWVNAANLVQTARRHLGVEAVPLRPRKAMMPAHAPITMAELGRYYLRRVGEEFIFRTDEGKEEVWTRTADPSGMIWRRGGRNPTPIRLVFKNVMGLTEKRV